MATPVNEHRGEAAIELEGVSYKLRPSYEAIVEIEKQIGMTISGAALAASNLGLPLTAVAVVTAELIKAGGRADDDKAAAHVNARRIGELIFEAGLLSASLIVATVLTGAATGGYTPAGEARATGTTTTAPHSVA